MRSGDSSPESRKLTTQDDRHSLIGQRARSLCQKSSLLGKIFRGGAEAQLGPGLRFCSGHKQRRRSAVVTGVLRSRQLLDGQPRLSRAAASQVQAGARGHREESRGKGCGKIVGGAAWSFRALLWPPALQSRKTGKENVRGDQKSSQKEKAHTSDAGCESGGATCLLQAAPPVRGMLHGVLGTKA